MPATDSASDPASEPRGWPREPASTVAAARAAQTRWAEVPLAGRLRLLRRLRHRIASSSGELAAAVGRAGGRGLAETLTSEIVPLADAIRFLEREAPELLAPRRPGAAGRPAWLTGVELEIHRLPLGVVLIVGPSNYPLFLAAAQALQALAAGNAAVVKPGRGARPALARLAAMAADAGLDPRLLAVVEEAPEAARAAIAAGVDRVVLTGSVATGRAVLAELAPRLVPATMELSGHDAVFVRHDADLERTAAAVAFGLRLNAGDTCIAPRRIFVARPRQAELAARLAVRLGGELPQPPVLEVIAVAGDDEALERAAGCPLALGASVFGRDEEAARRLARRVPAGAVAVNDLIVPTADPRVPFGGSGESGYGRTRGAEGLLEMTRTQAVSVRRSRRLRHTEPYRAGDEDLFAGWLALAHGGSLGERLRGLRRMAAAAIGRSKRLGDRSGDGKIAPKGSR